MKHALVALAGIAIGLPVLGALASRPDGQPAGGLPARYVPWGRVGHRVPTAFANPLTRPRRHGRRPAPPRPGRTSPGSPAQTTLRASATTAFRDPRRTPWRGSDRRPAPSYGGQALSGGAMRPADLELSIAAPESVRPGDSYSYWLKLTNRGPGRPGPVTIRSTLPPGTVRTGAWLPTGVGGYADARDAALVVRELDPGRSLAARLDVRVLPEARGELVARGRITSVGGEWDRLPGDDAARVSTLVRP